MAVETIPSSGRFDVIAGKINNNFNSIIVDVNKLGQSTVRNKGLYSTEAALKSAIPSPVVGDWAIVGSTVPGTIYECRTKGTWTDTGNTGGGGEIDLTGYVTATVVTDASQIL